MACSPHMARLCPDLVGGVRGSCARVAVMSPTVYQSADVDGGSVFYREAGPPDGPTILLLHGFPSSSRMWEPLLTRLADAFHLIAPDSPGFGHSDPPDPAGFAYTFDRLAEIIGRFTEQLGLGRYTLFMQDYGGPIGFRLPAPPPARGRGVVVHNGGAAAGCLV